MPELSPDAWAQIRAAYEHSDTPVEDICLAHGISSTTLRNRVRRWGWTRRRPPIPREGPPPVAKAPQAVFSPPPVRAANGGEGLGVGGAWTTDKDLPPTPLRLADASRSDPPHRFAGGGMEHAAPVHPTAPPPGAGKGTAATDDRSGDMQAAPHHPTPPAFADAAAGDPPPPGEGEEAQADAAAIVPRLQSAVARVLPAIEATIARLAAGPYHPRDMEQAGRALSSLTRTLRELNTLLAQHHTRAAEYDDMPEDIDAFRHALARRIEAFVASRAGDDGEAKPEET